MPRVKANDIELYYEVHGQGYPVVFLHGFSATTEMWRPQVPALSAGYRFIIYDARGHGKSESPPSVEQYSADIVVEDLLRLLGALGIEKAVVGGLSMGGYESLRFYLTHPGMVSALIVMDTGPGYRNPARRDEWNRGREELARQLETTGIEALAATVTDSRRDVVLKHDPIGLAHMSRKVVAQHDSWVIDNLDKIEVPTLVLVGENDEAFLRAADYMVTHIPGAEKIVIPQAGHAANIDNAEAFNRALLDFLTKLDLPGG